LDVRVWTILCEVTSNFSFNTFGGKKRLMVAEPFAQIENAIFYQLVSRGLRNTFAALCNLFYLSVGCGTGLVEKFLIDECDVDPKYVYIFIDFYDSR
jgi:hypothetical protein